MSKAEQLFDRYHKLLTTKEYLDGFNAFKDRIGYNNNPHKPGTNEHDAWEFGWDDAWDQFGNKN